MKNSDENIFEIEIAHINTLKNQLAGKNISINLNNLFFDEKNEPRFKGNTIKYQNGNTEIQKVFLLHVKKQINALLAINSKKKHITLRIKL